MELAKLDLITGISFYLKTKNAVMKNSTKGSESNKNEIRRDLQDGSKGKDLSYLNEMPQMGGYEGVKAGSPPAKDDKRSHHKKNMADES
jgi:hypothetical protein